MKKILISPRFLENGQDRKATISTYISDFLLDQGYLPITSFCHTKDYKSNSILDLVESYLENVDGLILQGGNDISPELYGQKNTHSIHTQIYRDYFEKNLVEKALNKNLPVFGICRGMQMINVVLGGSLHQNLSNFTNLSHFQFKDKNFPIISIEHVVIEPLHKVNLIGPVLTKVLGKSEILINSIHKQAVDKIGQNLDIEAVAIDGIIEAFSYYEKKILATQWHPELALEDVNNEQILKTWLSWI